MKVLRKMGKGISNLLVGNEKVEIDPVFSQMSQEELLATLPLLDNENRNLKAKLNELTSENEYLKNSMINDKESSSGLKQFYKDMKYTFIDSQKDETFNKDKCLKDLLYEQYLLYEGLEDDEVNFLNKLKVKEDDWSDNKDFFLFKQKIIERNYQQLFKNLTASQLLNEIINGKEEYSSDEKLKSVEDIIVETKKEDDNIKKEHKKEHKKETSEKKKSNRFNEFDNYIGNRNEEVKKIMLEDLLEDSDRRKNEDFDEEDEG